MSNIGLGRISTNLFPNYSSTIYFFVLTQKSNKKSQSRLGGMKKN